jgi:Na+(H+)/acetate symporter ActP
MGVLIAPYLRKFGGFTLPSYLGRRFDSRIVRLSAAAFLAVPLLLVLAAEIAMAMSVAERLSGLARPLVLALIVASLVGSLVMGGLRSATWTATAQGIIVALAMLVPSGIIAVLAGNLPLPQLSHGATLRALDVIDIQPLSEAFYGFDAKYTKGGSRHVLPADVKPKIYQQVQHLALVAHRALGCRGVSRTDFRYDDGPGGGDELVVLEVNTQPGMTETSLVPELAAYAGYSFGELVRWMVEDASCDR